MSIPPDPQFKENLRLLFDQGGFMISEAADTLGVSPSTVSRWLTGSLTPHSEFRQRILNILEANHALGFGKAE